MADMTRFLQNQRHSSLALILLFALGIPAQAEIYKTVDEDGNVVFTDIPPREDDENAEQIIVENPNSFAVEEAIPNAEAWIVEAEEGEEQEPPFRYTALEIVSPSDDEPVRENAGNITIVTNISPRLQRDHVARLLMDGVMVQEGPQTSFSLVNVDQRHPYHRSRDRRRVRQCGHSLPGLDVPHAALRRWRPRRACRLSPATTQAGN